MRAMEELNPKNNPEDYWDFLSYMEVAAIDKNHTHLKPWDSLAKDCMAFSIQVPFLKGKEKSRYSLKIAATFLKRSMSDFRGVWLMLNWGYPYQAACVAASLYENSLIVNCISDRDDLAKIVATSKNGDIPWGAKKLSSMSAEKDIYGKITGLKRKEKDFERVHNLCYRNYKWLCKIKHPTMQQISDEINHAMLENGTFSVVPLPDSREDSISLKQMVLIIAISRLFSAAKSFATAINCEEGDELDIKLYELATRIHKELKENINSSEIDKLPIHVYDFKI